MTNAVYSQLKQVATAMLTRFGTNVVLTSREGGKLKGKAVFVTSSTQGNSDDNNTKTIYFQGTDKDPAPAPGDLVTFGSVNWGIVSVEDYNPDGSLTVVFKMQVSK